MQKSPIFIWAVFYLLAMPSKAFGSFEQELPVPDGLQPSVDFWQNIFTKYQPHHCVYHDTEELRSIFVVKKIPTARWKQTKVIAKQQRQIEAALRHLAKGQSAQTSLQRRVKRGVPAHLHTPSYWRKAAKRVRCQRGVDFQDSLKRSRDYLAMIKTIFRQHDLPEDLAYLPHLESGFDRWAHSSAGARGMWQFIRPIAKGLGLKVARRIDQRTHPYKSTVAAAKHLKILKEEHKKWPLAITAYNYGTNGMRRAIQKYGYDYMTIRKRHRTRIFKFAAKNYYPSVIAVRNIAKKKKPTGLPLAGASSLTEYRVKPGDSLTAIATKFDSNAQIIKRINGLKRNTIYPGQVLAVIGRVSTYKVQTGDNLTLIADRFNSTVHSLKTENGLRTSRIYAGQILKINHSQL